MAERRLRLFVALELPEAVREALADWSRRAARAVGGGDADDGAGGPRGGADADDVGAGRRGSAVRPVAAGSMHVTLCFLGDTAAERVGEIAGACEVARGVPVGELGLGGALWLPRRRPRVLAVELEDAQNRLAALQGELSRALAAIGVFEPDARPFLAHVSVARVRGGGRTQGGEGARGADRVQGADRARGADRVQGADRARGADRVRGGDRLRVAGGGGRDRGRAGDRNRQVELPPAPSMRFAAERVVLYRSSLGAGPARYDALHEVQLSRR